MSKPRQQTPKTPSKEGLITHSFQRLPLKNTSVHPEKTFFPMNTFCKLPIKPFSLKHPTLIQLLSSITSSFKSGHSFDKATLQTLTV